MQASPAIGASSAVSGLLSRQPRTFDRSRLRPPSSPIHGVTVSSLRRRLPHRVTLLLMALICCFVVYRPRVTERPPGPEHMVHNGLLYTNLDASRHPIDHLIAQANEDWEKTLRSQSKSLRQAAAEYKRRYGRLPPKGFDQWYAFARKNDVQLIDEYDQVDSDIAPFYGMSPSMYRAAAADAASQDMSWTWIIKDHNLTSKPSVEVENDVGNHHKALAPENWYIAPFLSMLGDFNLTMNMHDGPRQKPTYRLHSRLLESARQGQYIETTDSALVPRDEDKWYPIFANACPPDSVSHVNEMARHNSHIGPYDQREFERQPGVFVENPSLAMDPCHHPELIGWHGTTIHSPWSSNDVVPFLSQAKDSISADIVFPYTYEFYTEVGEDPAWEDKPHHKVVWRGASTGQALWADDGLEVSLRSQRIRLVNKLHQRTGTTQLIVQQLNGTISTQPASIPLLNEQLTDCAISGIVQCVPGEVCDLLVNNTFADPNHQPKEELNKYRYLLDIDGNSFSGRTRRLMMSNSLVIKAVTIPEWYTKRVKPWVHYVPALNSYEDLYDILTFFEGAPNRPGSSHEALAREIAHAGKEWIEKTWRIVDMQAYALRILLEIARLSADDRDAMSYRG